MIMRKLSTLLSFLAFFLFSSTMLAQGGSAYGGIQATPKYSWEAGVHGGHFFSSGDVAFRYSYGAGFHLRRALDYVFSLRLDGMYGLAAGDSQSSGHKIQDQPFTHQTTYASLSLQGVMVLNNLRWDKPVRKVNMYVFFGAGPTYIQTKVEAKDGSYTYNDLLDIPNGPLGGRQTSPWVAGLEGGAGIAVRVTKNFNLALEHKGATVFGKRADLIDGVEINFRDVLNYTALRLNFNLRGGGKLAEPLYWVNPLDVVLTDISELKARPILDLTDTDGDGVIDILDQDPNSPPGVPVDTRGVPLDSDGDGIPDYLDKEPFSPPGVAVDGEGVSQDPTYRNQNLVTKEEVNRMITETLSGDTGPGSAVVEWFLPMVHFNIDSYKVRDADYGNLASIARVLNANPRVKVVVQGFTDQTASVEYNNMLSFNRAQSAIDHLVNLHGVDRSRLVLQYGGKSNALVPSSGSNFMNRRVEFRVATPEDMEMERPQGGAAPKVEGSRQGY
jgi:OmpA-OmpF porin, OOP family